MDFRLSSQYLSKVMSMVKLVTLVNNVIIYSWQLSCIRTSKHCYCHFCELSFCEFDKCKASDANFYFLPNIFHISYVGTLISLMIMNVILMIIMTVCNSESCRSRGRFRYAHSITIMRIESRYKIQRE